MRGDSPPRYTHMPGEVVQETEQEYKDKHGPHRPSHALDEDSGVRSRAVGSTNPKGLRVAFIHVGLTTVSFSRKMVLVGSFGRLRLLHRRAP